MPFPLLAFIVIPIAELLLILSVADLIGGWLTLGLVIITAFIGINVLKRQGFSTLSRAQSRLRSGQLPAQEIVEGMLLAFAGAMLLTPGFITDTIGFTLLAAPMRRRIAKKIMGMGSGFVVTRVGMGGFNSGRSGPDETGDVFEGEYRKDDEPRLKDAGAHDGSSDQEPRER